MGVCAAFLEIERHLAAIRRVADGILQQVQQDVSQLFRTNLDVQFRSVDRQGEVFLVRLLYFLHQPLAEGAHVLFLGLVGLGQRLLQVGKFLNVLRKASQGLYTRLAVVQRGQRRFHLRRYVLDELRLQLVVLVGQCDGFLLLAAQHKKAQQDDSHTNQSCCQNDGQDAKADNEVLFGRERAIFFLDSLETRVVLLLQRVVFALSLGGLLTIAFLNQLADGGVPLIVLPQGVEIGGLRVEQVGFQ